MKLYRAWYESQNFSFSAYGLSAKEALDALYMGLNAHREQYDLDADWFYKDDVCVEGRTIGSAYRDESEIYIGKFK